MSNQPHTNRGTLIAVILNIGKHTFRQTKRQVGIHSVIISIKADALEVFLRKTISIGPVICQPQSCLHKEPGERTAYGSSSDTHKEHLALAQLRSHTQSQDVIVQTKRTDTVIGQHPCSCHNEHMGALQLFDYAEPSVSVDWNCEKDLFQ